MPIAYLKGTLAAIDRRDRRAMLVLEVGSVGYELQVLPRWQAQLPPPGEPVQAFVHLQVQADRLTLFGFATAAERDLFRQLIATNGVGPQLAVALMDGLELSELVQAIVAGDARLLAKTPGIGPKTAARIALELRNKLAEWRDREGLAAAPGAGPVAEVREDVELSLLALGYSSREVMQALAAVGQQRALAKTGDTEAWIREAIAWLSR